MKQWFEQLSQQERYMLIAAAAGLVLLLLYLLAIRPLVQSNSELRNEIADKQDALLWMQSASQEIRSLQSTRRTTPKADSRTLIARVNSVLRQKSITPAAIKPEGEKRLRMTLEAVSFTTLMERLDLLQSQYGVRVMQATIDPASDQSGRVNARLTLAR